MEHEEQIILPVKMAHLGDTVRTALRNNKMTIGKAAGLLKITRQSMHSRLNNGNFFYSEIYILHKHKIL